jgi:hypothetical protein
VFATVRLLIDIVEDPGCLSPTSNLGSLIPEKTFVHAAAAAFASFSLIAWIKYI